MKKKPHSSDAELEKWARKATVGVRESATFMSLWNEKMMTDPLSDPQVIVQIGLAMLLDKPIIIVAPQGARIPENVKRVARSLKYYVPGDMPGLEAATRAALQEAGIFPEV